MMNKIKEFIQSIINYDIHLNPLKIFKNAYYWLILPLVIIFIALLCGTIYATTSNVGFANVGIEFSGGTVVTVEMFGADVQNANYDKNIDMVEKIIIDNGGTLATVQSSGSNALVFRYPNRINGDDYNAQDKTAEMNAINTRITNQIEAKFKEVYGNDINVQADAELINATTKGELISKSILSIIISMVLIGIYIMIRFDLFSGLAAAIGVVHDVIIMLAFVIIFKIQINSSLIAGIITLVAYSINNTIIVFDRVRDMIKPFKVKNVRYDIRSTVDIAVSETLRRSMFTAFTTLIMLLALSFTGVPALVEFALPIAFGVVGGFYSSSFIVPCVWGLIIQARYNNEDKKKSESYKDKQKAKALKKS